MTRERKCEFRKFSKKEEMVGEIAASLVTMTANILCPEFGEFMANVSRMGGFGAEIYGNLSGDKEIEKLGEIV